MQRTQISLTYEERRALDAASARTGRSVSALIRAAVDAMYVQERSSEEDLAMMRRAFGAWSQRDAEVAEEKAGRLRRWLPAHRGTDAADLAIAATAVLLEARLLTTNVRHFPHVPELSRPY